jgi:hypothetical protein
MTAFIAPKVAAVPIVSSDPTSHFCSYHFVIALWRAKAAESPHVNSWEIIANNLYAWVQRRAISAIFRTAT